jgi:hypothetical protein
VTNILSRDNRLFALARQGKRQASALQAVAVVIGIVTLMIAAQVVGRVIVRLIHLTDMQSDAGSIVEGVSGFLAVCTGLGIWLRLWSKRSLGTLGFENRHPARHIFTGTLPCITDDRVSHRLGNHSRNIILATGNREIRDRSALNWIPEPAERNAACFCRGSGISWLATALHRLSLRTGDRRCSLRTSIQCSPRDECCWPLQCGAAGFPEPPFLWGIRSDLRPGRGRTMGSVRGMRCGIGYKVICLGFLSAAVFIPAFWSRSRQVVRPF